MAEDDEVFIMCIRVADLPEPISLDTNADEAITGECSKCKAKVWIAQSSLEATKGYPRVTVVCKACAQPSGHQIVLAPAQFEGLRASGMKDDQIAFAFTMVRMAAIWDVTPDEAAARIFDMMERKDPELAGDFLTSVLDFTAALHGMDRRN